MDTSLLLIGCGNMGGALLKGWARSSATSTFGRMDVVKPSAPSADIALDGVTFHRMLAHIDYRPSVIVWGVKPHQLEEVVKESILQFGSVPTYVSIAAGKTLADLQGYAEADTKIVRAMPNTPVAIGQGITGLCATQHVSDTERSCVETLFASVGEAVWIEESQMNALTALCGSGPAYVYYFMECLAAAAADLGLDQAQADMLARQMVLGAAGLACEADETLAALRQHVTSPNGTTAAALDIWMQPDTLDAQAKQALKAAVQRALEMQG